MSDASYAAGGNERRSAGGPGGTDEMGMRAGNARAPFPWTRVLYALGFSIVAWVMFWLIVLLLAPLHYIVLAITGTVNEDLKQLTMRGVNYLVELLMFIAGASDEIPFPLGPIPKG